MKFTLDQLIAPNDNWCFLAGAGISIDPPSGLPSGQKLIKIILNAIVPEELHSEILGLMDPSRAGTILSGNFLRFEQLMEFIWQFDPGLGLLDGFEEYKDPNFNHFFLAHMLVHGHSVFTTNFDSLIEYALLKIGQSKDNIHPVILPSDINLSKSLKSLVIHKLHGSVTNVITEENTRPSLKASTSQIAGDKGELFTLEKWKIDLLTEHIKSKDLMVLGYAGLDELDVIPSLVNIPSTKRLFWVVHENGRRAEDAEIIQLSEISNGSHPTQANANRLIGNLRLFEEKNTRLGKQIFVLRIDSRELLKWLWLRYLSTPFTPDHAESPVDQYKIPPFTLNLTEVEKWWAAAKLLKDRNKRERSLEIFLRALELAKEAGDNDYITICLNSIGRIYSSEKKYEQALDYYHQALEHNDHAPNISSRHQILNNIGIINLDQGNLDEALKHFESVLKIAEMLGFANEIATYKQNLGSLYRRKGNNEKALQNYKEALEFVDAYGNIPQKGVILNNMATIYHEQGDSDQAIELFKQAMDLDEILGDYAGKQNRIQNLASIYIVKGDWGSALKYFEEGIRLNEELGDNLQVAFYLTNAGAVLGKLDRLQDAEKYLLRGLKIYQEASDDLGVVSVYYNLGVVYILNENLTAARQNIGNAKKLALDKQLDQILPQIEEFLVGLTKLEEESETKQ